MKNSSPSFMMKDFLKSVRPFMIFGLLFSCTASLANFALLFLSGWFLAAAAAAGLGGIATQNLFNMFLPAAGVRFFATIRIIARYCERLITHDAALRMTANIRTSSFSAMIPRAMMRTIYARSGDILSRFVSDTEIMGQYPLDVVLPRQNAILCSLFILSIFAAFNHESAFIMTIALLLGGIILPFILHLITRQRAKNIVENTEKLKSDILETLQGMADIIFCGAAKNHIDKLEKIQKQLNHHNFFYKLYTHLIRQLFSILSLTTLIIVIIIATKAYQAHHLTAPEIPMLTLGTLAAFEIISPLLEAQLTSSKSTCAEKNVQEFCTHPYDTHNQQAEISEDIKEDIKEFDLVLKDISLKLQEQEIYKKLNLILKQGERIAITGPSGIGKTTLTHLVTSLITPDSGEIYFGPLPLTHYTTEALSNYIGVLPQKPHLFLGSIKRNLLIAAPNTNEEEMWQALDAVCLRNDIEQMPDKLDTLCGEAGIRLSGGQIRRLAAAQLILRKPKLLILDEPTESLPPKMGISMLKGILNALPYASVFCITHRHEPLSFMNHIYELQKGYLIHKNKEREKD